MIETLTFDRAPIELAFRQFATTEVALLWSMRTHRAAVAVLDDATGAYFELLVGEGDDPLDLFEHPYAYAAARGIVAADGPHLRAA